MKLTLIAVGKLKNSGLVELCNDYQRRVERHVSFRQLEVKDERGLARAIDSDSWVVALEVKGKAYTSLRFAEALERWGEQRSGRVTFLIGGAEGLPAAVSCAADEQLSLSTLTLPHRLARVLLCEQIYRTVSLWRGEPYAREDAP